MPKPSLDEIFGAKQQAKPSLDDIFQVKPKAKPVEPAPVRAVNAAKNVATNPEYSHSRPSGLSEIVRSVMGGSVIGQMETLDYYARQMKDENGNPVPESEIQNRMRAREEEIKRGGALKQLDLPISAGLAMSGAAAPVQTAKVLAKFMTLDAITNAIGLDPEKIPDSMPNLKDSARAIKFIGEGALAGQGWLPKDKPEVALNKAAAKYREVFQPSKGDINKVEVKSGKNLDDSFKLMAQSRVIPERTPDGKLDTSTAREQLQDGPIQHLNDLTKDIIESNPEKQFNLEDLRKESIAKIKKNPKFKNDLEQKNAISIINEEIDAAIENRGQSVTGKDLNEIKQGMWRKSYNIMQPNSKHTAREIGFVAKDMLEKAYPDNNLKDINKLLGEYLTVDDLLESAHGRVVNKGKIGRYVHQMIGATALHHIPVVGPIAGSWLGGHMSEYFNDPASITAKASKDIPGREMPGKVHVPEILNKPTLKEIFGNKALPPADKPLALPNLKDRSIRSTPNESPDVIKARNEASGDVIHAPNPVLKIDQAKTVLPSSSVMELPAPIKEAQKHGKVVGIDAETKLPIIDTSQAPETPNAEAPKKQPKAENIKPKVISEGVLEYDKLYHGSENKSLSELDPAKSKRTAFGANAVVSVTDNPLLAKSFIRGELGDKPEGRVYEIPGNFKIIDISTPEGNRLWESFEKNPKKALSAGYDGIQHNNYEKLKIESFYKDIPFDKVKDAKEIQIFRKIGISGSGSSKVSPIKKVSDKLKDNKGFSDFSKRELTVGEKYKIKLPDGFTNAKYNGTFKNTDGLQHSFTSESSGQTYYIPDSKMKGMNPRALAISATAIVAAGAAAGNAKKAEAALPKDEDAVKAIIGEVGPYGKEGMLWVACAIRNRNNGLKGIYGAKNPNVVNKKYTPRQEAEAKVAWRDSAKEDVTGGATNWYSDADLKQANVQNDIKNMTFIRKVGGNSFYKPKEKK